MIDPTQDAPEELIRDARTGDEQWLRRARTVLQLNRTVSALGERRVRRHAANALPNPLAFFGRHLIAAREDHNPGPAQT